MNCNCRWTEFVVAVLVLVFTIWPTQIFAAKASWWLVVIAAAVLLVHSLMCSKCHGLCTMGKGRKKK